MKPKPFASLNHFTVPFATLQTPSYKLGRRPCTTPRFGRTARPPWSGLRTTNRPDTTKPQGNFLCGAESSSRRSSMNRQATACEEYRSRHVRKQHKFGPRVTFYRL